MSTIVIVVVVLAVVIIIIIIIKIIIHGEYWAIKMKKVKTLGKFRTEIKGQKLNHNQVKWRAIENSDRTPFGSGPPQT